MLTGRGTLMLVTGALIVVSIAVLPAQSAVETAVTRSGTIVLAEILRADPDDEGCPYFHKGAFGVECITRIQVRIARVYKGDTSKIPTQFETEIRQVRPRSDAAPWGLNHIETGQQYLVSWRGESGDFFVQSFSTVHGAALITDQEDTIADLELLLTTNSLSFHQQVMAVATALSGAAKPRSWLLAEYAAELLVAGKGSGTETLAKIIDDGSVGIFSEPARGVFLSTVREKVRSGKSPDSTLLKTYIRTAIRYLVLPPGKQPIREEIVRRDLPWILASKDGVAALRVSLSAGQRLGAMEAAATLAEDSRTPAPERARLRELIHVLRQ